MDQLDPVGVVERTPERQQPVTEGRAGRPFGGKVDASRLERLVARLMSRARLAKKATTDATRPLLNAPDSLVAKALAVANRAI